MNSQVQDYDYDYSRRSRPAHHSSDREPSYGADNRMDRLQNQIQEARASLNQYSQNSPLRQQHAHQQSTGAGSMQRQEEPRQAYEEYMNETQARGRSNQSSLRQRSQSQEAAAREAHRSRPSTDLQEVQGGYTEFFSWGNDDRGQLGHGIDSNAAARTLNLPKSLSFEVLIAQVACGSQHSSFITNDGHIFSFGSNSDGQLGIDDRNLNKSTAPLLVSSLLQSGHIARKISCGSFHTLILMESGSVFSWGRNTQGQCGSNPSAAPCFFSPHRLNFEASHPVDQIECGDLNSALITKVGHLYTFGDNSQGQLGLGNGVFRGQLMVDKPTRVQDIFDEVVQVSCGYRHSLALTAKGAIYGFGSNRRHEMGLGEAPIASENNFFAPLKLDQLEIHNIVQCAAGGFSAAITDLKQLIVWGTGQFGVFSTPQKVCMDGINFADIQISKQESSFAAAVDRKGAIYSWGPNFDGQLGHGDFNTRTLPTQIARLKRKQIRSSALGDRFAIAIGKDVSLADLMRRKAAKAKKQQEQIAEKAARQNSRNAQEQRSREDFGQKRNSSAKALMEDSAQHMRQSSIRQHHARASSYSRDRLVQERAEKSQREAAYENDNHGSKHGESLLQAQRVEESRPLRTTGATNLQGSPEQSQAVYSNFALTTNLNNLTLHKEQNSYGANPVRDNTSNHGSPLRQRSRGASLEDKNRRSNGAIAVGGQELSAERAVSIQQSAKQPMHLRAMSKRENFSQQKSPHEVPPRRNPSPQYASGLTEQRKPAVGANESNPGSEESRSAVERLFKLQLEEKENVIRRQQETIQELRVQITQEQRVMGQRNDELNERIRNCEVERNDLRTRLASELRGYQGNKQELVNKLGELEAEIQRLISQHESRETFLQQEAREREAQRVSTLEHQHRAEVSNCQENNRLSLNQMEIKLETMRAQLQDELSSVRNLLDHERTKLHQSFEDNAKLESDKRSLQEQLASRGMEVRDQHEQIERHLHHIKALEIERDTVQERMQVTVSQMNAEIAELQRSIGLKNVRLDEFAAKEEDYRRQLDHEKNMVARRDIQIDEQLTEVNVLRKQIEDQHLKICGIEASKADLDQRFQDLHIQFSTQQDKLKNEQQHSLNLDNQLQSTRLQLERERQRCEATQADLDGQNACNAALRRDLAEEQHRVSSREADIRSLESSLAQLKESMGAEYAAKSRDFENLKRAYEDLGRQHAIVQDSLKQRNDELDSSHSMNRELQAHATALLDKVSYQESVILELEDKNKRLTDLLNAHLYDQAQNYKDAVLTKLSAGRFQPHGTPHANQMPDCVTGRFVSPFADATSNQARSVTPERAKNSSFFYEVENGVSQQRLAHLLRREQGEQDALNKHYVVLQQQLNKEKFHKSPIRGHEVDLAAGAGGTVSMANIQGPVESPAKRPDVLSIPAAIFSNQTALNISQDSGQARGRRIRQASVGENGSPLRQKSPKPQSLKDRERDATQAASLNYSQMKINLGSAVTQQQRPGIPNFSASQGPLSAPPQQYSPLRSRTPPAKKRVVNGQEQVQMQTQSISASNISHKVMMNELRNLRGQIANVQRQKNELESRLQGYEATQP